MRFIVVLLFSLILFPGLVFSDPPTTPENVPEESIDEVPLEDDEVQPEILEAAKKRAAKIRESREKNIEVGDPCKLNPNLPVCK